MFPRSDVAQITPAPRVATTQARRLNARPDEVPPLSASQRTGFASSNFARRAERKKESAGAVENGNLKVRDLARTGLSCQKRGNVQPASTSMSHANKLEAAREIQYLFGSGPKADSPPSAKG